MQSLVVSLSLSLFLSVCRFVSFSFWVWEVMKLVEPQKTSCHEDGGRLKREHPHTETETEKGYTAEGDNNHHDREENETEKGSGRKEKGREDKELLIPLFTPLRRRFYSWTFLLHLPVRTGTINAKDISRYTWSKKKRKELLNFFWQQKKTGQKNTIINFFPQLFYQLRKRQKIKKVK